MKTHGEHDSYSVNAPFWVKIIRENLDRYRTELTDHAVLTKIGTCKNSRILDVGCGEGYLSRKLAQQGARVTGIDPSQALIQAAVKESHTQKLSLNHYLASAESIPEADSSFDVVVCNHIMTDVADPAPVLKELGRITKPGGKLIILMLHPCFYTAHSEREESNQPSSDLYFSTRVISQPFSVAGITSPAEVRNTFRPLEQYTSAIFNGGFVITGLSEPHPSAELSSDPWWQKAFKRPLFLLLEAERR